MIFICSFLDWIIKADQSINSKYTYNWSANRSYNGSMTGSVDIKEAASKNILEKPTHVVYDSGKKWEFAKWFDPDSLTE